MVDIHGMTDDRSDVALQDGRRWRRSAAAVLGTQRTGEGPSEPAVPPIVARAAIRLVRRRRRGGVRGPRHRRPV